MREELISLRLSRLAVIFDSMVSKLAAILASLQGRIKKKGGRGGVTII